MPSDFPRCTKCGHVFFYQVGVFYPGNKAYINLQEQWSNAHRYGGEDTRKVECPECGQLCEVGYKCTMKPVSRKAVG